jgi:hypothetical protein
VGPRGRDQAVAHTTSDADVLLVGGWWDLLVPVTLELLHRADRPSEVLLPVVPS